MSLKSVVRMTAAGAAAAALMFAQQSPGNARALERASKVKELTEQLKVETKEDSNRYTPEYRDKLTDQVRQLLKEQVLETLTESGDTPETVLKRLKTLDPFPPSEYSGAPYVFRSTLSGTPVIITGFLLVRGPAGMPETKAFLQAYRKVGPVWEYVAETGDDLDHHELNLVELKSPRPGEMWLLAYGVATGSNILSTRFRVYAFNGEKFTTIWNPPNRPYAEVTVKDDELVIRYRDYEHSRDTRTDRYWLTFSGVEEVSSVLEP